MKLTCEVKPLQLNHNYIKIHGCKNNNNKQKKIKQKIKKQRCNRATQ